MSMQLALGCAAVSAATAFGAALFELQQFSRKRSRWPWRSKDEQREKDLAYPPFGFWIGANVVLRMAAVAVLGGVLGGVGWIADVKAGIPLGLMGALSLSSLAGIKDTGVVQSPVAPAEAVSPPAHVPNAESVDLDADASTGAGGQ
ncbi:hypothetical protein ACWEKT_39905 [Nocardia takedensis]